MCLRIAVVTRVTRLVVTIKLFGLLEFPKLEKKAREFVQLNPTAYKTLLMTKALHAIWFGSEFSYKILTYEFSKGYDNMLHLWTSTVNL